MAASLRKTVGTAIGRAELPRASLERAVKGARVEKVNRDVTERAREVGMKEGQSSACQPGILQQEAEVFVIPSKSIWGRSRAQLGQGTGERLFRDQGSSGLRGQMRLILWKRLRGRHGPLCSYSLSGGGTGGEKAVAAKTPCSGEAAILCSL